MTLSGPTLKDLTVKSFQVLIPLLVDDPLRERALHNVQQCYSQVLIPLLVDDPLRECKVLVWANWARVLIPLLVDDPLRVATKCVDLFAAVS